MKRRAILDTNFLLIPAREGVDVFGELERVVPGAVQFCVMEGSWNELESLIEKGSGKVKVQARLAKTVLLAKKVQMIPHEGTNVDEAILQEAKAGDVVATMDKALKQKLKAKGVDIAVLRSRRHVVILQV